MPEQKTQQKPEQTVSKKQGSLLASEDLSEQKEDQATKETAGTDNYAQTDLFASASEIKASKPEPAPITAATETPVATKPETINTAAPKIDVPATEIDARVGTVDPVENKIETTRGISNDAAKQSPVISAPVAAASTTSVSRAVVKENIGRKMTDNSDESAVDNNLFDGVQSKLIPDEYRIPVLHNAYSFWQDLLWSLAILMLTASLFVEYTWFNRNELIRNPQLRPLVTQFCNIANCDVMALREPAEIEMTTRNIYTHPNVKNALMISGTLINHALFEQPYPDILIDFSNVRGEVIASRVFTPKDYLQIKVSSLRPMGPNTSIDFNMEIQDPGKNAMTYEFSFL